MTPINASNWKVHSNESGTFFGVDDYPANIGTHYADYQLAFAWVKVDHQENSISAARDHFGLEPFYYCIHKGQFIFGSSLPDILKQLPSVPELNTNNLLIDCFRDEAAFMSPYNPETYYTGIYRLTPGHSLRVSKGRVQEEAYWELDPDVETLQYKTDEQYVERFSELLEEAVNVQTGGARSIALEFSGGLDSASIVAACQQNKIPFIAFGHTAPDHCTEKGEIAFAHSLAEHFNLRDVYYLDGSDFNPIEAFQYCAGLFAGASPYLFFTMAHNIHKAVSQRGCDILLSGFGGDQCVSSHVPSSAFYPELLRSGQIRRAFGETAGRKGVLKRLMILARFSHPRLHSLLSRASQRLAYYKSLRHLEYDMLQGTLCHEIRMRVEYSALVAKAMGFSYRYPLLYPKLVEFCFRLPLEQKRRFGTSRYLIRSYLARHVPEYVYQQQKKDGAHILPGTMQKCRELLARGYFDEHFRELDFVRPLSGDTSFNLQLAQKIAAYMVKYYGANRCTG